MSLWCRRSKASFLIRDKSASFLLHHLYCLFYALLLLDIKKKIIIITNTLTIYVLGAFYNLHRKKINSMEKVKFKLNIYKLAKSYL